MRLPALAALLFALPASAFAQSGNLIVGGPAAARCVDDWSAVNTVPGWTVTQGAPSVVCHAFARLATPAAPANAGFLANGPYGNAALSQVIDISAAAAAIDAGGVSYTLSGWLGGWQDAGGQARVTATFLDGYDDPMPTLAQIGGVNAATRGGQSGLLARSASGPVPPSARRVLVQVAFTGTQPFSNAAFADTLSFTLSDTVPLPTLHRPPSRVPAFDHVFLVMMENTDFSQVIGDTADAPFINQLAAAGTLLANHHGVYHPSDENYLAVAGGDTFVHGAIYFPDIHVAGRHLGDRVAAAGKSWKVYEQGMGRPCTLGTSTDVNYAPDDAPFANFTDIQTNLKSCRAHLVDTRQLIKDLASPAATPNFAWIAADYFYDGELPGNGSPHSLRVQDGWLKATLAPIFAAPAWTAQRSLLILTWDKSSTYADNHVATILVGSPGTVQPGAVSYLPANHYGIARTIEAALGLAPLTENDAYARPFNEAFGRTPAPSLSAAAPMVSRGARLIVGYATPVPYLSTGNWVGVFPAGATPDQAAPLARVAAPSTAGSLAIPTGSLRAGDYDVYFLYDGGTTPLAPSVRFTLTG